MAFSRSIDRRQHPSGAPPLRLPHKDNLQQLRSILGTEPVAPDNPLLRRDDVVLTPHIAWLTRETLQRSLDVAVANCHRLANAQPLLHRVV